RRLPSFPTRRSSDLWSGCATTRTELCGGHTTTARQRAPSWACCWPMPLAARSSPASPRASPAPKPTGNRSPASFLTDWPLRPQATDLLLQSLSCACVRLQVEVLFGDSHRGLHGRLGEISRRANIAQQQPGSLRLDRVAERDDLHARAPNLEWRTCRARNGFQ